MNPEELKEFVSALHETDIEELRIESGATRIFLRKSDVAAVVAPIVHSAAAKKAAHEEKKDVPIKSPMVGTFYHSESSDHPPFVIEGNHIVPGQKIGIIEAMKLNKNVASSISGKIVKILVKNGQSVEYGQEIFMVDTEAKEAEKER